MRKRIAFLLSLFLFFPFLAFPMEKKDFTLPEIEELGLKNNPLLLAKAQEVEAKKAAFQASKRLLNPELELHAGQGRSYDNSINRKTDGISLSQYLENPVKRHYRVQMYEKAWQAVENSYNFTRLEVIYNIKKLFFKVILQKNIKNLAQKNLNSLEETHQLIVKRVKLGETKELEAIKLVSKLFPLVE